ncbi:hypothetical protein [Acinetobacter rudis]|uniref:Uncharacterized protein n=1 Tax=Acinetobacter rudis CIP 110305 TaxID=421052 RepID=S3NN58_9GAMM|nr:hypothetical protein [Acinetobacter rudis]EPF79743.1 hypothetical protein F945_00631 [Acinetobacter rudis CIP 110305]
MDKKYLNLEVSGSKIRIDEIEFDKNNLYDYIFPFNFFIDLVNGIVDGDETNKSMCLINFNNLIKLINVIQFYEMDFNGLSEKFLHIFNSIFPYIKKNYEGELGVDMFLKNLCDILNKEVSDIYSNHLTGEFILKLSLYNGVNEIQEKNNSLRLGSELDSVKRKYNQALIDLKKYENSLKNKTSVELYSEIGNYFKKLENKYRRSFLIFLFLTLILTVGYNPLVGVWDNFLSLFCSLSININTTCMVLNDQPLYPFNGNTLKYIIFKIAILLVGVTLATYFLRLTSFYQLRQEQSKQTKLELEAFPDFVSGMSKSVANNIREELALKYFGKDVDKTQLDKSGNLLQEQLLAGIELIKVNTELMKLKNTSNEANKAEENNHI